MFSDLPDPPTGRPEPEVVKAEILLVRVHISPGAIDGLDGDNFRKAVTAFQKQAGLATTGRLDGASWNKLTADTSPVLMEYRVTAAEAKGPFTPHIPANFEAQSRLKHLGYPNIREALGEQFHMSPSLLRLLNPRSAFAAGSTITVPALPPRDPADKAAKIVVDKAGHDVEALSADGKLLGFYPASIGSAEKPAPSGSFVIRRIVHHPDYTYLPQFHFKGVPAKHPFTIAPGPRNPVGVVWMDLSFEGYGIHGTPDPEAIGKTQSHGCIRLTNWDAEDLAKMVEANSPVDFVDGPQDRPVPPSPVAATP